MEPNTHFEDSVDRLVINVSGAIFEISEEKVAHFPESLLGCPQRRQKYFDLEREEYFFDRHRQAFEGILFYYQSEGRLIYPDNVPAQVFEEEVKFFMLPIEPDNCQRLENVLLGDVNRSRPLNLWQRTLWELFEFPNSSTAAKVLAVVSQVFIVVSIAGSCLKTVESLQPQKKNSMLNATRRSAITFRDDEWLSFDLVCYGWFTFECAVRLLASPNKSQYFKLLPSWADFATIIIFYLELIIKMTWPSATTLMIILETLATARILKIVRYSAGMKLLVLTIASGIRDLGLLVTFATIVVILASSAVFFVEFNDEPNSQFQSIPDGFWWAIITICTVGYGDKVPKTPTGKFMGAICAVLGTVTIALPLFRFASHFRSKLETSVFSMQAHRDSNANNRKRSSHSS